MACHNNVCNLADVINMLGNSNIIVCEIHCT